MIIFLLIFVLVASDNYSVTDTFKQNGIVYELLGKGNFISDEHCQPWTLDLFPYANYSNMKNIPEYGLVTLKRKLHYSLYSICTTFNITTSTTVTPPSFTSFSSKHSRYLDSFELTWNLLKFENDLKSLFLYNKIIPDFFYLIKEKELTLFNSSDVLEIAERAIFIPLMCNVHQMQVEMNLCINEDRHTGEVYAIAHAGQFTNDDKAYVYYDTPEYVVANGDSVLPVQMNNCKILNGSSIYCFAKMTTRCNVFTMESCQILARKVGENFTFTRNFGSAKIIATTESELDIFHNGTFIPINSPIFMLQLSNYLETYNGSHLDIIESINMKPTTIQVPFPQLTHDTMSSLTFSPIRVYFVSKKGKPFLSDRPTKPTIWDGFREFFLHLI